MKTSIHRHLLTLLLICCASLFPTACMNKPIVPDSKAKVSEITSTSVKLDWDPSPSEKAENGLLYCVVFTTSNIVAENLALALQLADKKQGMDWAEKTYSAAITDLSPETSYYFIVLAKKSSGTPVIYKTVTASTIKAQESDKTDLTVTPPEMVFVQGGKMNIQGKLETVEDFYIGKYEVTNREYYSIEKWGYEHGYNESYTKLLIHDKDTPAIAYWGISIQYCNLRSMSTGLTPIYYQDSKLARPITSYDYASLNDFYINIKANGYRLPTEAEWEYAARGGSKSQGYIYSGSNNIDEVAWSKPDNRTNYYHIVGQKKSNELGIYDMSGNASEWCINYCNENKLMDLQIHDMYYFYKTSAITKSRIQKGGDSFRQLPLEPLPVEYYKPETNICEDLDLRSGGAGFRIIQNR